MIELPDYLIKQLLCFGPPPALTWRIREVKDTGRHPSRLPDSSPNANTTFIIRIPKTWAIQDATIADSAVFKCYILEDKS